MNNKKLKNISSFLLLSVFLYYFYIYINENNEIFEIFYKIEIRFILALIFLNLMNYLFRSFLNIYIFRSLDIILNNKEAFQLAYRNTIGNLLGPLKAGSGYKMHYIYKNYNLEPSKYISLNTAYAFVSLFLNFLIFLIYSNNQNIFNLNEIMSILSIFILVSYSIFYVSQRLESKVQIKIIKNFVIGFNALFLNKKNFFKLIFLTIGYIYLNIFTIYFCFQMFEYDVNFINSTIYSTIGSLNSLAKVTPGNIGLFEILMISSSSVHGVKINEILTTSIVMRIISYLTIVLIYLYNVINKLSYRGK